jgi:hypothetical protein
MRELICGAILTFLSGTLGSNALAAIAHVQDIGAGSVTGGTAITITAASGATAGDLLLIQIGTNTNAAIPTVTDSRGNTYLQGLVNTTSSGLNSMGFYGVLSTSLLPGDQITITFPLALNGVAEVSEFSGTNDLAAVSATHNSSSSSFDSGPPVPALTGELLLGWVAALGSSSSVTQDPAYTPIPGVSANGLTLFPAYQIAPSGGSFTFTGTLGASEQWVAMLEDWRIASAPPPPPSLGVPTAVPALDSYGIGLLILGLLVCGMLLLRKLSR